MENMTIIKRCFCIPFFLLVGKINNFYVQKGKKLSTFFRFFIFFAIKINLLRFFFNFDSYYYNEI